MKLIDVYTSQDSIAFLYELLRERSEEDDKHVNISHRRLPTMMEHCRFFASRPYHAWELIEVDGHLIGYVSQTKRNEIGIILMRAERGKGYGRIALQAFLNAHKPLPEIASERSGHFLANINPLNEASIKLFTAMGFNLIQHTYGRGESNGTRQ